jgi:DNA primase
VIICEGYTDVMAYALAGNPNAVATCGTALADEHAKMLKNLARRVVLAYDADSAGQGAAERWYRWEQELDLEVRVADLPAGSDPGDLWRDDRDRLPASIENAKPFLQFRIDRVLGAADLSTNEGRARAAGLAAAIVAEHPNELVRDQYAVQVADRLDLAADGVRAQIARGGTPDMSGPSARRYDEPPPPEPDDYGTSAPVHVSPREADVLLWAIHEPKLVTDWLDESLFLDPTARGAYHLLIEGNDVHEAIDAADGATRLLLERLAVEEPKEDAEPETRAARLVAYTVEPVAKRLLVRMLRDDDEHAGAVRVLLDNLAHAREIGEWDDAQSAAKQLVGWIVHEAQPAPASAEGVRVDAEVVEQPS